MLSIRWIQDVNYYLDQATADYYYREGEPPGRWWGRGAKSLRLIGTVQAEQLKSLCKGYAPDGTALTQNAGAADHQQAWDLTFSAPKSVSVLWSQVDSATRLKIRKLHQKAIQSALTYLTDAALLTRRGKGGTIREKVQPIVAIFEHGSNRELEPQLHSHCVLVNAAARADGTFGTILSEPFYRHKMTAGALYQAQFAYLLQSQLGLQVQREKTAFSVVGVPQKLVDHYSTRSKQIQDKLRTQGIRSAKAAALAALDTRKRKQKSPPARGLLFQRWQETNGKFGFTQKHCERLLRRVAIPEKPLVLTKHIALAIKTLLETESFFSEQQLIRRTAIDLIGEGVAAAHIIDQVKAHLLEATDLVALGAKDHEPLFTTHAMLAMEAQLLTTIDAGKSDSSHVINKLVVERILNSQLPLNQKLSPDEFLRNEEQRNAVRQLTMQPGNVQVMEGMAGTGKTYTLKVAKQTWEKAGYRVVGMALSAAAAENLQEGAGIESETIALRLLQLDGRGDLKRHHKRQVKRLLQGKRTYAYRGSRFRLDRKTVVVVDEAGMVGTRQMAELVKRVRKAGAKLVLIGDRRQLQPIEAGGPFAAIADKTERAELKHVVRQQLEPHDPNPAWHRQAGELIAAGHVAQAIQLFQERGRLTVQTDREQASLSIVRDWSVKGIQNPDDHVILAGTREEVAQLNELCQSARASAGALGTDAVAVGEQSFRIGDNILFTKNSRLYHIKNGNRGTVLAFNHLTKTMAVRLTTTQKEVFIPYRSFTDLQLGYAMTTHKAQGATVPSVYVLLGGPMQDRHLSYVQSTRACESTRLYVDKYSAGPQLKHLLNQMAKLRLKRLAHEVRSPIQSEKAPPPSPPQKPVAANPKPTKSPAKRPTKPKPRSTSKPSKSQRPLDVDRIEELLAQLRDKTSPRPTNPARATPRPIEEKPSAEIVEPPRIEAAGNVYKSEPAPLLTPTFTFPEFTIEPPRRNVIDLSHLNVTGTTNREILETAVSRYGRLPGGIVVEGQADCDFRLDSVTMDPSSPGILLINDTLHFDTGLTDEEIALLWQAVFDNELPSQNFGALNQCNAIGIDDDTIVASTLMQADNAMGGIVYGYDSMFTLCDSQVSSYHNPYLSKLFAITGYNAFDRICFNYLYDFQPQVFLQVDSARFSAVGSQVRVASCNVQAAIGVAVSGGALATTRPPFVEAEPNVKDRFPCEQSAFQHFVKNFAHHAKVNPSLARSVVYGEVVMLMRSAKAARAFLDGRDYVKTVLALRQHRPLARFDYTLRTQDFERRTSDVARYLARRTDSRSYESLLAAVAGLNLAAMSGDTDSFLVCKQAALNCLTGLFRQTPDHRAPHNHRELHSLFDVILDRITNCAHDVLITNGINAALRPVRTAEERSANLQAALRACGTEELIEQIPATRCRWLEVKSYLDPKFDPVSDLAAIRSKNVTMCLPFDVLNKVNAQRSPVVRWNSSREQVLYVVQRLNASRSTVASWERPAVVWQILEQCAENEHFWHFGISQRSDSSLKECLISWRTQHSSDPEITKALSALIAVRLIACPPAEFSKKLLHRNNPFFGSHELLGRESLEGLAFLFSAIRGDIERFDSIEAEDWWRRFLSALFSSPLKDASKVGLLLAYELKLRGMDVGQLYRKMRESHTENPQAALLLFDSDTRAQTQ